MGNNWSRDIWLIEHLRQDDLRPRLSYRNGPWRRRLNYLVRSVDECHDCELAPLRRIMDLRRVSRTWDNAFKRSPLLHSLLFLGRLSVYIERQLRLNGITQINRVFVPLSLAWQPLDLRRELQFSIRRDFTELLIQLMYRELGHGLSPRDSSL